MIHSLVMTVRTMVMLSCMIALPLAAVFWPTISDQLRVWLAQAHSRPRQSARDEAALAPSSQTAIVTDLDPPTGPPSIDPPPAFDAALPAQFGGEPPGSVPVEAPYAPPAAGPRQPVRNMSEWSKQSRQDGPPEERGAAVGSNPALAGPLVPMSATSADLANGRVQQAGGTAVEPAPPSDVGLSALPRADHAELHAALGRLRALGANYYRLETDGRQYHFSCDVAVSADSNREKRFTASGIEPRQAVGQVLAEVEGWRSQGR